MPSPQGEGEGRGKRGGRREGGSQAPSCSGKHNNRQGFKEAAGSGVVDSKLPLFTPLSLSLSVFRKVGEKGHTDHAFFPTLSTGLPATSTDAATPPGEESPLPGMGLAVPSEREGVAQLRRCPGSLAVTVGTAARSESSRSALGRRER